MLLSTSSRRRGEVVVRELGLGRQESLPSVSSTGHVRDTSAAGSRTVDHSDVSAAGATADRSYHKGERSPHRPGLRGGWRTNSAHQSALLGAAQQHSSGKAAMSAMP